MRLHFILLLFAIALISCEKDTLKIPDKSGTKVLPRNNLSVENNWIFNFPDTNQLGGIDTLDLQLIPTSTFKDTLDNLNSLLADSTLNDSSFRQLVLEDFSGIILKYDNDSIISGGIYKEGNLNTNLDIIDQSEARVTSGCLPVGYITIATHRFKDWYQITSNGIVFLGSEYLGTTYYRIEICLPHNFTDPYSNVQRQAEYLSRIDAEFHLMENILELLEEMELEDPCNPEATEQEIMENIISGLDHLTVENFLIAYYKNYHTCLDLFSEIPGDVSIITPDGNEVSSANGICPDAISPNNVTNCPGYQTAGFQNFEFTITVNGVPESYSVDYLFFEAPVMTHLQRCSLTFSEIISYAINTGITELERDANNNGLINASNYEDQIHHTLLRNLEAALNAKMDESKCISLSGEMPPQCGLAIPFNGDVTSPNQSAANSYSNSLGTTFIDYNSIDLNLLNCV